MHRGIVGERENRKIYSSSLSWFQSFIYIFFYRGLGPLGALPMALYRAAPDNKREVFTFHPLLASSLPGLR